MPELGSTQKPAPGAGTPPGTSSHRPKIVGFLCDWAVSAEGLIREDGTMRDLPNVTLIRVMCSGFIRPAWLEFALRNGAEGAFVCGCPLGDCFNRFGNNLIGDRVLQMRRRLERQKIHPDRVATMYFGLHAQAEFVTAVREFSDRVAGLPGPVTPPARPAARAGAPGQPPAARRSDAGGEEGA
ncbi:MAG TPA: hydrogenase iron-sulfur subunit [bacterium]|nr:hydrogenase iron-sulfur subunit [bacterium]